MKKRGWIREKIRKLRFRKIKTWQLFLILIVLLIIDATMLRFNHVRMTELRSAVLTADEVGDDAKTAEALQELQDYVFNNIVINVVDDNGEQRVTFGTGPFYLENTYRRAASVALAEAEANLTSDANPNGNVYQMASEVCKAAAIQNGWSWDDAEYMNCMLTEIQKYPAAEEIQDIIQAKIPSTELYRKDYASPIFVPTVTGWMLLLTVIVIVVIFIRILIWIVLRLSLLFM